MEEPVSATNKGLYIAGNLREDEAELSLAQFAQREPHVFHRRLVKGPPPIYRWVAWKVALRVQSIRVAGLYEKLRLQKPGAKWLKTIQKDLDRTFPTHPLFASNSFKTKGQTALESILTAYSLYSPAVGYCQGMNFVVAFLLIMSGFREEDTFWVFAAMMKNKVFNDSVQVSGIEGLYVETFPLLRILQSLFWALMAELMPVIKEHLDSIDIPEVLWLHKWFSTLFIYSLPISYCIRLWDYIFATGLSGLLRVSAAILKHLNRKEEVVTGGFSECCEQFKFLKEGRGLPPIDKLIDLAERISVDWTALELVRQQVARQIDEEAIEAKKVAERVRRPQPPPQKVEEGLANDQRGECAGEDETPKRNNELFRRRFTKRKGRTSSKKFKSSFDDSLRLPPIMSKSKKQFVFESNSEEFCSDGGNAASDDNNEVAASNSLQGVEAEGCVRKVGRRKSFNLMLLLHSARSIEANKVQGQLNNKTERRNLINKLKGIKNEQSQEQAVKEEPKEEKVFARSPNLKLIEAGKIEVSKEPQTDREFKKVSEDDNDPVSHSMDNNQERGGRCPQILF